MGNRTTRTRGTSRAVSALAGAFVLSGSFGIGGIAKAVENTPVLDGNEVSQAMFKTPHVPGELIVKLRETAGRSTDSAFASLGIEVVERRTLDPNVLKVRTASDAVAQQTLAELRVRPDVEYVEPNYLQFADTSPNDPRFKEMWGLDNAQDVDIDAPQAWEKTTGSEQVVVGIIDSGTDITHVDLKDNIYKNPNEIPGNGIDDDGNGYVDDVNGWDAVDDDGSIRDADGHGTHVSGTVAARGNNSVGVVGVNWRAKILPLRFISVTSGSTFDAIQCIDYAVRLRQSGVNLRVLNNSWGGTGFSTALFEAIKRANDAGILFVCASGNDGVDNDAIPHYPSSYEVPNVVSVGAMSRQNYRAGFSNYGKRSVDLYAPGDTVLSTLPGDKYGNLSGTSMASPHVAGVATLVVSMKPDVTVSEMKARLFGSVVTAPYAQTSTLIGGRVNAAAALRGETTGPAPVADFGLRSVTRSTIVVHWTSVGDDGTSGTATYYDIRYSSSPITEANFTAARQINDTRVPLRAGSPESAVVRSCFGDGETIYIAMRVFDKAGNYTQTSTLAATPSGPIIEFTTFPAATTDFSLGQKIDLSGDDLATEVELPFAFTFFGAEYHSVFVSTNGLLSFAEPITSPTGTSSDLQSIVGIAPLWFDLVTNGKRFPNEGVFVDSNSQSLTIRWIAEQYYPESSSPTNAQLITFAATLHRDGQIDLRYGPGGNRYLSASNSTPLVGVSDGGCYVKTIEGYSGRSSLADVADISLKTNLGGSSDVPSISTGTVPNFREGFPNEFTISVSDPLGMSVTVDAGLPRNAAFDHATGKVTFAPDSAQDGDVRFLFTATTADGRSASRTIVATVVDDSNKPEIDAIVFKKKITFVGLGFRSGSKIEIDGTDVGDTKSPKSAPASKLVSKNARAALDAPGIHVVIVVTPTGERSGPYYFVR